MKLRTALWMCGGVNSMSTFASACKKKIKIACVCFPWTDVESGSYTHFCWNIIGNAKSFNLLVSFFFGRGNNLNCILWFPAYIRWNDLICALLFRQSQALSHLESTSVDSSDRKCPVFNVGKEYSCQVLESTSPGNFGELTSDSQPVDCSNQENSDNPQSVSTINEDDTSFSPENSSPRTNVNESGENNPSLSAILGMDSVARVSTLRKSINSLETKSTLSRRDCMWLFALCAAVDTPLHADTCAALRSLLRKCASMRAEMAELDDEVIMLNILVTIAGRYFKQSENWGL